MQLGIVQGRSGWPLRVSGGGPSERSIPESFLNPPYGRARHSSTAA